ncbi:MAG TPA: hypothetical protein VFY96_02850 [Candidatus Binatia bacterium]|nr:hypothetical protein [Candidatus Binatia bacterium]
MSLIRLSALAFLGFTLSLLVPPVGADELNVYFKTTPGVERLRPYADPASMSLLVTDANGRPLTEGSVALRLDAPRSGVFFSTDFPWVEGTHLQEMQLDLRQGRANWKYLLPIRGEYRLAVNVITADGRKASKEFTFNVRENEKKWGALAAFSAGLFCLGFTAGRVFTAAPKEAVIVLLALLSAFGGRADSSSTQSDASAALEVAPATVGRPTLVRWRFNDNVDPVSARVLLSLAIVHLEKGKPVFEVERIPVPGEFAMNFQFTDGAEYRLVAVGEKPGRPPVRSEKVVAAAALEPPAKAMIPAFGYFIGLIAIGLALGRWSKRREGVKGEE